MPPPDDDKKSTTIKTLPVNDENGVFLGNKCFIPSSKQAENFCKGYVEGVKTGIEHIGIDKSLYQYSCNVTPRQSPIPTELAQLNDPSISELFTEHDIDITHIDPQTNATEKVDTFTARRMEGKVSDGVCKSPAEIHVDKFCSGFIQGVNEFINKTKLNKEEYNTNCIHDKEKQEIVYGIKRK